LDKIAKLTGWKPKRIAAEIGRTEQWVTKHISQKYKDALQSARRKKANKKSSVERRSTESDKEGTDEEKKEGEGSVTLQSSSTLTSGRRENEGEASDFEEEAVTEGAGGL